MSTVSFASPTRALCRVVPYLLFTLACMPVQAALVAARAPGRRTFPKWYHARCLRLLGLKVVTRGTPASARPTLYVANHVSYLDISVLGALLPASFIAKAEVADWPLFGWLAKLQRTVFVERNARRAADHRDEIGARLAGGDDLILFPEGTSGDGNRVLPFKSALFSVAQRRIEDRPLTVQPVSIAYAKLDDLPMGRELRPFFAWYGDMDLAPHIWEALSLGTVTVIVTFDPPVSVEAVGSRKALAAHCQTAVSRGLSDALFGHGAEGAPTPPVEAEESQGDSEAA